MLTKADIISMWDKNIITVSDLKDETLVEGSIKKLSIQEFYERVLIHPSELNNYGEKILVLTKRELSDWQDEHPNLTKKLRKQYQEYMANLKAELDSKDIPDISEDEI